MATANTIPDLDRRLVEDRGALVNSVDALRTRVQREVRGLNPRAVVKRHAGAALSAAAVVGALAGLLGGRMAAGIVRSLL